MDFFDAYFDFNTLSLKLPGFSISAFKYWDGQVMRYRCMSKDRSAVFFGVVFEYLDRETLGMEKGNAEEELKKEDEEEDAIRGEEFPPELLPPPEILEE
ncbi:hypothetical protein HDV05_000484, partial [Chytridiales sp. JEL 0842]